MTGCAAPRMPNSKAVLLSLGKRERERESDDHLQHLAAWGSHGQPHDAAHSMTAASFKV